MVEAVRFSTAAIHTIHTIHAIYAIYAMSRISRLAVCKLVGRKVHHLLWRPLVAFVARVELFKIN